MTDFAASCYYARRDGAEATEPERDLMTVRGAASWGLEGARTQRAWDEPRRAPWADPECASATFRHAALDCAGICALMLADDVGRGTYALKWARAYRHLLDLADRADRARASRAGGAT
ncbi:MAG TPA: hypothetical protein VFE45_05815 [Coriobacteriia bacterium]|nr:hypothetical protein [Coriobacteriia bacterium]